MPSSGCGAGVEGFVNRLEASAPKAQDAGPCAAPVRLFDDALMTEGLLIL
jgi:hypothetical protein